MNAEAQDPRESALHLAGRVGAIGRAAVPRLHFTWAESGVRMGAGAAPKPGFGYELVNRLVGSELRGNGEMLFLGGGVLCSIQIPLIEALHRHEQ